MAVEKIKVTLVRSLVGRSAAHRSCVLGLGLRHIGSTVLVSTTPENMGMVRAVSYLIRVEKVTGDC